MLFHRIWFGERRNQWAYPERKGSVAFCTRHSNHTVRFSQHIKVFPHGTAQGSGSGVDPSLAGDANWKSQSQCSAGKALKSTHHLCQVWGTLSQKLCLFVPLVCSDTWALCPHLDLFLIPAHWPRDQDRGSAQCFVSQAEKQQPGSAVTAPPASDTRKSDTRCRWQNAKCPPTRWMFRTASVVKLVCFPCGKEKGWSCYSSKDKAVQKRGWLNLPNLLHGYRHAFCTELRAWAHLWWGWAEGVSVPQAAQPTPGEQWAEHLFSCAPKGAKHLLTNAPHGGSGADGQETAVFWFL